jgi:hypothetical protein
MSQQDEEDEVVNKQGWLWLAPQYFDQWRVFPRLFIVFYLWLCMQTALWFMGLADPTNAQAGFAGAIVSAGAAWFGLYVNSGPPRGGMTGYTTAPPPAAPYPETPLPDNTGTTSTRRRPKRTEEPIGEMGPEDMDDGTPRG